MSTANKLTYLNETKQEIKQAINNLGGDITSETTFRKYADSLKEVYNNAPKTSFQEGTEVTLSNGLKGKIDFENDIVGYGDTEQETTNGYQLINIASGTATSSVAGVTVTQEGDIVTVNGSRNDGSTSNAKIIIAGIQNANLEDGTYLLTFFPISGTLTSGRLGLQFRDQNGSSIGFIEVWSGTSTTKEMTFNESVATVTLFYNGDFSASNYKFKVMLSKGSTAHSWEKFTGGIPAPNPSFPFQVKGVAGKNRMALKTLTETTTNGITFTPVYENGLLQYVNVNGTASATASYTLQEGNVDQAWTYSTPLAPGTYTLSDGTENPGVLKAIYFRYTTNGSTYTMFNSGDVNSQTFTVSENVRYTSYIRIQSGQTLNNVKFKPMLEEGSQATYYLPYNTLEEVVEGVNKINVEYATTTASGVTCTKNGDGTYTINGTATATVYFDLCYFELPAGTYKLVGCPSGGSWANYVQYVRRVDGQTFSLNDMGSGGTITTTGEEGQLRLSIMIYNGYTANNLVFKPMITTNTSLTYNDYEPYHTPISYPILLGNKQLYDECYIEGTPNNWNFVENYEKYTMTGEEIINMQNQNTRFGFDLSTASTDTTKAGQVLAKSNYFKGISFNDRNNSINSVYQICNGSSRSIQFNTGTRFEDKTAFTNWVIANHPYIVYLRETPIVTPITDTTLIEQLNNWYNAQSFNGTTVITSNGNLPMPIKVRALKRE